MKFRLLAVAEFELDEAARWYRAKAPDLEREFLREAAKVFRRIERYPEAWQPLVRDIRRCRFARFPYGVIYRMKPTEIVVLAIAHLHRSPNYWRTRMRMI